MTRLAVIDLGLPGSERSGRVFLNRDLLSKVTVPQLEQHLGQCFFDAEDAERMALLEELLRKNEALEVAVFPGEESPPAYHAYIKDPTDPDGRFFACVLAPEPVVHAMVHSLGQPAFETATFQVMSADTTPAAMKDALEVWCQRVWPQMSVPQLTVRPWPVEEVRSSLPPSPDAPRAFVPRNAPTRLDVSDFASEEELSA